MAKKIDVREHDREGTDGVRQHTRTLPDAPMGESKGNFQPKKFPKEFKRTVSFIDGNNKNVKLDIKYYTLGGNRDPYFSISGHSAGGSGQVDFVPKNEPQQDLQILWDKYHLKSNVPSNLEEKVDQIIYDIEEAELNRQDDLGLDGWQLIAMQELAEAEDEVFTDAISNSDYLSLEGAGEYMVFESYRDAERYAEDYVRNMLEDEPEMFTQSWLQQYMTMSDTDRRITAGEEADAQVDNMDDQDIKQSNAYDNEIVIEIGDKLDYLNEKLSEVENDGSDDALAEGDAIIELLQDEIDELEKELDDAEEEAIEDAREQLRSDLYDEIYDSLSDPYEYFVEEQGMYSPEDFFKSGLVSLDVEEAVEDAIAQDGVAHFLSSYDGNEIKLPSGAHAYRTG